MSTQDHDFATGDASTSLTIPTQASALRKGDHILIKAHPCKINAIATSKPGKHGHAKVSIDAYDIFTHNKYIDIHPAHATVEVPTVTRKEFQLVMVSDDGFLSLYDVLSGEMKEDVRVPETEVGKKIGMLMKEEGGRKQGREVFVVVVAAMGREMVVECKEVDRE